MNNPYVLATLVIAIITSIIFIIRLVASEIHLVKLVSISLLCCVSAYIIASAILFVCGAFSVFSTLLLEFVCCIFSLLFLATRNRHLCQVHSGFKSFIPLMVLAFLALVLTWRNFGYFAMGQDEGVYQTQAIEFIYGNTDRVYHFAEYDKLSTDEEREAFANSIVGNLMGLYSIKQREWNHPILPSLINPDKDVEYLESDSIYHGIPTYPALLALWGGIFGIENMAGIQSLMYILALIFLWFTCEKYKFKKTVSVLICTIYVLSPEILWLSKSTLTETGISLFATAFMYFLSERNRTDQRWISSLMVVVFSLYHVTIFVMFPMFFFLYVVLYLLEEDKQYYYAAMISSISFIIGFTFMVYMSPSYTIYNTVALWKGGVGYDSIYSLLILGAFLSIVFLILLRFIRLEKIAQKFVESKVFPWVIRLFLTVLLVYLCWKTYGKVESLGGIMPAINNCGLYDAIWMTGLISLPVSLVVLWINPRKFTANTMVFAITILFMYSVVLMCCLLRADVGYLYYYGRYMASYIPVACVFFGIIWDQFSGKLVIATLVISCISMLPFDYVLVTNNDDTRVSYDSLYRIADITGAENSAIIVYPPAVYYLAIKAMTGNDCYFNYGDLNEQALKLSKEYDNVYYITQKITDWTPVLILEEEASWDDDGHRLKFCPFPTGFKKTYSRIFVYKYDYEYDEQTVATFGR